MSFQSLFYCKKASCNSLFACQCTRRHTCFFLEPLRLWSWFVETSSALGPWVPGEGGGAFSRVLVICQRFPLFTPPLSWPAGLLWGAGIPKGLIPYVPQPLRVDSIPTFIQCFDVRS